MSEKNVLPLPNDKPIGVFDSGVGGLSVLDALAKALPGERCVYVGDTAHMPYGERSPQEISQLAKAIVNYLVEEHQVKLLVVACNTSAGILADYWQNDCPLPVVEPVGPITTQLRQARDYQKIGLLATQGTLQSGRYQQALGEFIQSVDVVCTGFAKLVEDGLCDTPEGKAMLKGFLSPLAKADVEAIIFGCTHYPFAKPVLETLWQELSRNSEPAWLDPACAMSQDAVGQLKKHAFEAPASQTQAFEYFVTGDAAAFDKSAGGLGLQYAKLSAARQISLQLINMR